MGLPFIVEAFVTANPGNPALCADYLRAHLADGTFTTQDVERLWRQVFHQEWSAAPTQTIQAGREGGGE